MTIVIELKPEVQAELDRQAAARGVKFETYAAGLLEDAADLRPKGKLPTVEEMEETLRELAQYSDKIPLLPEEAFSRESMYQDHD
jgi:hypothetical protein